MYSFPSFSRSASRCFLVRATRTSSFYGQHRQQIREDLRKGQHCSGHGAAGWPRPADLNLLGGVSPSFRRLNRSLHLGPRLPVFRSPLGLFCSATRTSRQTASSRVCPAREGPPTSTSPPPSV